MWPGKADQCAALFDPVGQALRIVGLDLANVGQDDRVGRGGDERFNGAFGDRGKGFERLAHIVHVGEQRLRGGSRIHETHAA